MSENKKINDMEAEKVSGGGFGDFTPYEIMHMGEEAKKRGTCLRCGRSFKDSKIQNRKLSIIPIMDIGDQTYLETNLCGDCLSQYGSESWWDWSAAKKEVEDSSKP
ncbi:MAG: hypothetical protein Q4D57_02360 [Clostridia bacterium]|nr:hypothetical protein [Clostridia bacterium]